MGGRHGGHSHVSLVGLLGVGLIEDVADQFLQEIFEGHQTDRSTLVVPDQRLIDEDLGHQGVPRAVRGPADRKRAGEVLPRLLRCAQLELRVTLI